MAQRLKTDWILFFTVVGMVCFGLLIVYSASSVVAELKLKSNWHFFLRQLGWAGASFCVLMYLKRKDYRIWQNANAAFAALGIVLLLLVIVYFTDGRTHRWLRLGIFSLQPSEFAKPALSIFLAYFLTLRSPAINDRHTLMPAALALVLLSGSVVLGDLGTAMVLVATAGTVFYVAGLHRRYTALALAACMLLASISIIAKPYRLGRLIGYFDPEYKILSRVDPKGIIKNYVRSSVAPRDPTYQARQSKIALGSGGWFGLGLMNGLQKMFYLPEAHTDFIYAIVGEEMGFFGCAAVLAGFLIILWRGVRLYWTAPDDFGRYLALSITASIVIQAFINMSVVLDLAPTKGIPLPMISYGGSSLLSTLISLGLLLSVSERSD